MAVVVVQRTASDTAAIVDVVAAAVVAVAAVGIVATAVAVVDTAATAVAVVGRHAGLLLAVGAAARLVVRHRLVVFPLLDAPVQLRHGGGVLLPDVVVQPPGVVAPRAVVFAVRPPCVAVRRLDVVDLPCGAVLQQQLLPLAVSHRHDGVALPRGPVVALPFWLLLEHVLPSRHVGADPPHELVLHAF